MLSSRSWRSPRSGRSQPRRRPPSSHGAVRTPPRHRRSTRRKVVRAPARQTGSYRHYAQCQGRTCNVGRGIVASPTPPGRAVSDDPRQHSLPPLSAAYPPLCSPRLGQRPYCGRGVRRDGEGRERTIVGRGRRRGGRGKNCDRRGCHTAEEARAAAKMATGGGQERGEGGHLSPTNAVPNGRSTHPSHRRCRRRQRRCRHPAATIAAVVDPAQNRPAEAASSLCAATPHPTQLHATPHHIILRRTARPNPPHNPTADDPRHAGWPAANTPTTSPLLHRSRLRHKRRLSRPEQRAECVPSPWCDNTVSRRQRRLRLPSLPLPLWRA